MCVMNGKVYLLVHSMSEKREWKILTPIITKTTLREALYKMNGAFISFFFIHNTGRVFT